MNAAKSFRAGDVRVRLCFFVNVRKARGLNVAGGRRIGSIEGLDVSFSFEDLIRLIGVLKAGEDEDRVLETREA